MSVKTGDYIVKFYNHYGTELKELRRPAFSYQAARDDAERDLKPDGDPYTEPKSFTVDRRLFNSLDER